MKFGTLVRHHRESAEISLNAFAQKIGISPAYWSRIERNIEKPPKDSLIVSAAQEFGILPDDAFASAGRLPPDLRCNVREIVAMCRKVNKEK